VLQQKWSNNGGSSALKYVTYICGIAMLRVIAFGVCNVEWVRMIEFKKCGDIWQTMCAMTCKCPRATDFLYVAFSQQFLV